MPKRIAVRQDINQLLATYAETEATVKADADPACTICGGKGWHDGWDAVTRDPVMLRCPCVDQRRR